ncbi:MAG: 50S ribosome-binding GTPase [Planctomycetes bacterium]|nr:50S ribosome-binding GTPase [Planctomycetota bacterium]
MPRSEVDANLSREGLPRVREWIAQWMPSARGPALHALQEALTILDRDLLPRLDNDMFVVGLVGPNNAGKSAMFNGLLGRTCSPSRAYGGATRRLLAAHGFEGGCAPTVRGFNSVVRVEPGREGVEAVGQVAPAGELLVVESDRIPAGLLVVDAPDFDSIMGAHKDSAESLMAITDLAVVVVTRHTYQNLEVVEFLRKWLGTGRPWVLVYNEAPSPKVAQEHCQVLAHSVGSEPIALFHAPSDLRVAEGRIPLEAHGVEGTSIGTLGFAEWMYSLGGKTELQRTARAASKKTLLSALETFSELWEGEQLLRRELIQASQAAALQLANKVCKDAMPMGPVLQAFRTVLDRRPGLVRSHLRKGLQKARMGVMYVFSKIGGKLASVTDPAPSNLLQAEREALTPLWRPFLERLEAQLMRAGAAGNPVWRAVLEGDLAPSQMAVSQESVLASLESDPLVWQAFEEACEGFIEDDLDSRGNEWGLQALVDLTHLLPAAVAGAIIVKSGGLLTDMAVGSMGALSAMGMEQLSKFLGTGTANRARGGWVALRAPKLQDLILRSALPETWTGLQETPTGDPRDWMRWTHELREDSRNA